MKFQSILGMAALLTATGLATISSAQGYRHSHRLQSYGSGYGQGPFYPSWIPGASSQHFRSQRFRSGGPYRVNGLTYYFAPGGGTYYQAAPYGYGVYRRRRDSRSHRDYPLRTRRGWR